MSIFPRHSQTKTHKTNHHKTALFIIVSGGLLTLYGRFAPFLLAGGILTSIGAGLLYTLSLTSPSSKWIGYQILAGTGLGLCFQVPIMVGQALAEADDVAVVTAILMCTLPSPSPSSQCLTYTKNSHPNHRRRPPSISRPIRIHQHACLFPFHVCTSHRSARCSCSGSYGIERSFLSRGVAGDFGGICGCAEGCVWDFDCEWWVGGCGCCVCAVECRGWWEY